MFVNILQFIRIKSKTEKTKKKQFVAERSNDFICLNCQMASDKNLSSIFQKYKNRTKT